MSVEESPAGPPPIPDPQRSGGSPFGAARLNPSPAALRTEHALVARRTWLDRLEAWTERQGERLNPILVKEARQSLKSAHFVITFCLILLLTWIITMVGVAINIPDIYTEPMGSYFFFAYYLILAFPLLVIVPAVAFWSFSVEMDEQNGTLELISISTLGAWRILGGKMGSAVLQMLVYLSAVAPCLAFTYLLRGIDLLTIVTMLFWLCTASLCASLFACLLATVSRARFWQFVLLVLLIVVLLTTFISSISLGGAMTFESGMVTATNEFWIANAAVVSATAAYFALFYCLAAGQLSFASANRSTPPRVVILAHQMLMCGWFAYGMCRVGESDMLIIFGLGTAIHWAVMGAFMIGESADLSPRVRRSLPQSFLGRVLFTWFNPGPGTGLVFALTSLAGSLALGAVGGLVFNELSQGGAALFPSRPRFRTEIVARYLQFSILAWSYTACYLSATRFLLRKTQRWLGSGVFLSALIFLLLALAGSLGPWALHMMATEGNAVYHPIVEITNWAWALTIAGDGVYGDNWALTVILPVVAALFLLLNAREVLDEVGLVRVLPPRRVQAEKAAQEAAAAPQEPVQISPWDFAPPPGPAEAG